MDLPDVDRRPRSQRRYFPFASVLPLIPYSFLRERSLFCSSCLLDGDEFFEEEEEEGDDDDDDFVVEVKEEEDDDEDILDKASEIIRKVPKGV